MPTRTKMALVTINGLEIPYFFKEYDNVLSAIRDVERDKVLEIVNNHLRNKAKNETVMNYRDSHLDLL